jgi:hypothetical protein
MVFGVKDHAADVVVGFQCLFRVPTHPGWTCPACSRVFYVEAFARNHEDGRKSTGECDPHPYLSEHVRCTNEASFFFKLHEKFELLVRGVAAAPPRDMIPVDALDPTQMSLFHGTHPVERSAREFQASNAFFSREQARWARTADCLERLYRSYTGKVFVRQADNATERFKMPIQAEATRTLHWCTVAPFLKPFRSMPVAFRTTVLANSDETTLETMLAYLTRRNNGSAGNAWLRPSLQRLREAMEKGGKPLPPWLNVAIDGV